MAASGIDNALGADTCSPLCTLHMWVCLIPFEEQRQFPDLPASLFQYSDHCGSAAHNTKILPERNP